VAWLLGPLLRVVPLLLRVVVVDVPLSTNIGQKLVFAELVEDVGNLRAVSYPLPLFDLHYTFFAIC